MNRTRIVLLLMVLLAGLPASLAADGLTQRDGRFIRLTTDLTSDAEVDEWIAAFDAAVPQWTAFWGVPPRAVRSWKVDAYVMRDETKFRRLGLIPARVTDFPFGYALGNRVWVRAQQSAYYTRHLLLHEGVHAFMFALFRGAGPTWYMEGSAELLATHRGEGSQVVVNEIPHSREEASYWGRFKRIDQLRHAGEIPKLRTVLGYRPSLQGDVASYGLSWAAAMLLSNYPEYRPTFIEAARQGRNSGSGFNRIFDRRLPGQWPIISARWRMMCQDLDYGFDWSREQIDLAVTDPEWDGRPIELSIQADRGWQSAAVRIAPRVELQIKAEGQVTVAEDPKPWISEPPGITYRYVRGRPIGQLLCCLLPNLTVDSDDTLPPLELHEVGESIKIRSDEYCWLLLRVNDAVGELADNRGHYRVSVTQADGSP